MSNLNDSINALFKQGVQSVTLLLTESNESVVVVNQKFPMHRGGGEFHHQHQNTDWALAVQDANKAAEHIAQLQSKLVRMNSN